jgi:hypothetical protein
MVEPLRTGDHRYCCSNSCRHNHFVGHNLTVDKVVCSPISVVRILMMFTPLLQWTDGRGFPCLAGLLINLP